MAQLAVVEVERDKAKDERQNFIVMLAESLLVVQNRVEQLKELSEAAQAIADVVDPPEEGAEARPLVKRLRGAPAKVTNLAKTVCSQMLVVVKSYYPRVDLAAAAGGIAKNCSDDAYSQYLELEPIAEQMADFIALVEP